MHSDPLYWLRNLLITAREDDDGDDGEDDDSDAGDDDKGDDAGSDSDDDDSDGDDDDKKDDSDEVKNLRKALRNERQLRRGKEKQLRQERRKRSTSSSQKNDDDDSSSDDDKGTKEDSKLRGKLSRSEDRAQKLAEGFLKKSINDAILAEARKQGFIDPSDALLDEIRSEIDYEQDKEDPSQVDIDSDTVKEAVEDLADRKKHLIGETQSDDGKGKPKSGGKFKRKQGSDDGGKSEKQILEERYPSLR